ncbi:response regulator receiver protein, partial [Streptomyces sp. SID14478]|nr:response regulator receiver protein [Streptomyces sp. SID14478]
MADGTLELRLAAAVVECADTLADDFAPDRHLRRLTDACVELAGAQGAAVLLALPDGPAPVAPSAERHEDVRALLAASWAASPAHDSLHT